MSVLFTERSEQFEKNSQSPKQYMEYV